MYCFIWDLGFVSDMARKPATKQPCASVTLDENETHMFSVPVAFWLFARLQEQSRLCMARACSQGLLKAHLRTDDFIRCSRADPPENSLFYVSSPCTMEDLVLYLDLVEHFFRFSPRGFLLSLFVQLCLRGRPFCMRAFHMCR
jgi:hypothetical protein